MLALARAAAAAFDAAERLAAADAARTGGPEVGVAVAGLDDELAGAAVRRSARVALVVAPFGVAAEPLDPVALFFGAADAARGAPPFGLAFGVPVAAMAVAAWTEVAFVVPAPAGAAALAGTALAGPALAGTALAARADLAPPVPLDEVRPVLAEGGTRVALAPTPDLAAAAGTARDPCELEDFGEAI